MRTALWLHKARSSIQKKNMPRLHQLPLAAIGLNIALQSSIPLGFYGRQMQIEAGIFLSPPGAVDHPHGMLWRRKAVDMNTLLPGCCRWFAGVSRAFRVLLSAVHGVILFHTGLFHPAVCADYHPASSRS